jgi:hypothetical protein
LAEKKQFLGKKDYLMSGKLLDWGSYHSIQNAIGGVPFVSKEIAENLILNTENLSFYDKDGKRCTKYIWDDYSHFLFIKKDVLQSYIDVNKYNLVWCETGTRYGIWKS